MKIFALIGVIVVLLLIPFALLIDLFYLDYDDYEKYRIASVVILLCYFIVFFILVLKKFGLLFG